MKQTRRVAFVAILFLTFAFHLQAQVIPSFLTGAYHVEKNESISQFEVTTSESEVKIMIDQLQQCGSYIQVNHVKTEKGYLIVLRIQDQTGPEYVAKLMMVLGFSQYYWNNELKEIGTLEAQLTQP